MLGTFLAAVMPINALLAQNDHCGEGAKSNIEFVFARVSCVGIFSQLSFLIQNMAVTRL
jgi:hypothetical protein